MTPFPGLVRRAVAEVERHATAGLEALVKRGTGALAGPLRNELRDDVREEIRNEIRDEVKSEVGEQVAAALREQDTRIRQLEEALAGQEAGLADLRREITSLISQLNERLLPTIDERMDETERDLARLVTGLMSCDRSGSARESRLQAAEQRLGDLRTRLGRMEQRSALWRDLQATVAKLGDDVDDLRAGLGETAGNPPVTPLRETG